MNADQVPGEWQLISDEQLEEIAGGGPNDDHDNSLSCATALSSTVAA